MRLSSWFLCPTLRLLPEASHLARIRLLFRVARTARKRGVGFVLRAQREPRQPLEVLGVELAWFHGEFLLRRDPVGLDYAPNGPVQTRVSIPSVIHKST